MLSLSLRQAKRVLNVKVDFKFESKERFTFPVFVKGKEHVKTGM